MKKFKSLLALLSIFIVIAISLTACTATVEYELSNYQGQDSDADGMMIYNKELFYLNSIKQGGPDPAVLDDTARSGYYYLYATLGAFHTMRSKNLAEWENVGPTFYQKQSSDVLKITNSNVWAPEVIYDEDTKLYYMFFSATPVADNSFSTGKGIVSSRNLYNMYVATSTSPAGPFTLIDFGNADSCGAQNMHVLNTKSGIVLDESELANNAWTKEGNTYYKAAFPHYFARYCLFAPDELSKVMQKEGVGIYGNITDAGYFGTIDPHPFVDPVSGDKYLYFKAEDRGWNIILAVKMKNWLSPDWSTATYAVVNGYHTVQDWREGKNKGVSYEITSCNEGPYVIYHTDANGKGLYYLTFSVNDYGQSTYQVGMAVSESPLGPFRKLTEEEGGLLLCSSTTESESISGAGHHSFATLGDQLYIIYHRHTNYLAGGDDRYTAVDEVKWITVKDIFGNDMDIPYVNGPTDSIQPLPAAYSGYKNIADQATVTCTDKNTEIECVNDGLLSVHKTANDTFMSYIREAYISKQATFTFDFENARTIRAIMVYNSAFENSIFRNISKIELKLADGSTRVIRDVKFDVNRYCNFSELDVNEITYIMSGSCAFVEFYDIDVQSVKITIDVPEGQEEVGISEIRILGKVA